MKKILINTTSKELRVAFIEKKILYDFIIEYSKYKQKKSNIYKGKISHIEPSLEAIFVDYGVEKHGFLPFKEISQEYFPYQYSVYNKKKIQDILYKGQEIIVQVSKEEKGNKGAALTTFISLAGIYLVLLPNNPNSGGISRKIEKNKRVELKEILSSLHLPQGMSIIIRTAGLGKSIEILQSDLSFQLKHWQIIKKISEKCKAPFLIHQESNIIIRIFRDNLHSDISEILIDNIQTLNLAKKYITLLGRCDFIDKIKFYNKNIPLFSYYQIESQIESAFQRKITLPSGSSIVIDTTEALTAIDINSAKSTKGIDIEETAFKTNLEAANEIARQIRIRDLSGLIVIDFIDMSPIEHQREVENCFKKATRQDRARIRIGKISDFGLLELSRQRIGTSLEELKNYTCPTCRGTGTIRNYKSFSVSILRIIEEKILKKNTYAIYVNVPNTIAYYLLHEKKNEINQIQKRHQKKVKTIIISNHHIQIPQYFIYRIKRKKEISSANNFLTKSHNITTTILEKKHKYIHTKTKTTKTCKKKISTRKKFFSYLIDKIDIYINNFTKNNIKNIFSWNIINKIWNKLSHILHLCIMYINIKNFLEKLNK
ncbi:MAG: ribonuclease E [Candidatus Westeberhardia cardiocondylae]|nr:ribonuclease E [Candidatus Westeberhardia cardiocondylae]